MDFSTPEWLSLVVLLLLFVAICSLHYRGERRAERNAERRRTDRQFGEPRLAPSASGRAGGPVSELRGLPRVDHGHVQSEDFESVLTQALLLDRLADEPGSGTSHTSGPSCSGSSCSGSSDTGSSSAGSSDFGSSSAPDGGSDGAL